MDLATAVASPVPFSAANGRTYSLSPLRLSELGEFHAWIRHKPLAAIQPHLSGFHVEVQKALALKALEEGKSMTKDDVGAAMMSIDGARQLFTMATRRTHRLEDGEADAAVNESNFETFITVFNSLNEQPSSFS